VAMERARGHRKGQIGSGVHERSSGLPFIGGEKEEGWVVESSTARMRTRGMERGRLGPCEG
jgi:hypothetical protein